MSREFEGYVGMFDSGVGGLSVLKAARAALPAESFLFFGDSANTPYGEKPTEWIVARSREIARGLVNRGCKAVVIACNTATSAAAEVLRAELPDVPVVGVEPALKPAALSTAGDRILVMATPVTLSLDKFHELYRRWGSAAQVHVVPCTGLADRVEKGDFDAPDLHELLVELVGDYAGKVDSVVLGCTHYPFIKRQILDVLGRDVAVFDGGAGTARQLKRLLAAKGQLAAGPEPGRVELRSSVDTTEEMAFYRWLLAQPI